MVEAKKEADDVTPPEGSGVKLRDIPNVMFKLAKVTGEFGALFAAVSASRVHAEAAELPALAASAPA